MRRIILSATLAFATGFPAAAHEFWIEPEQYQVDAGDQLVANLKNGEEFEGISLSWLDRNFTRFEMTSGPETRPVVSRLGDTPAMNAEAWADGLMVIVHETTPAQLVYTEWEKFMAFAAHKDFPNAEADHVANGWSQERFVEGYTRHVKSLVAVGDGAGADRVFGLETEFVALTNPYADNFDGTMQVRVDYQGTPRTNAQVEVFEKAPDGAVTVTLHRTDEEGVVGIPVKSGHSYLFDAVLLLPSPEAGTSDNAPVWETLWAALTFAVP